MAAMHLTDDDRKWLAAYRKALDCQFPGLVKEMAVFGSKARGDDRDDSDLDLFLTIRSGDWKLKWRMEGLGYELAVGTPTVPSIMIITEEEKTQLAERQSSFYERVQEEGSFIQ